MLKMHGQESDTPKEFDTVKKAKHYNVHPSGIECIEVTRCLSNDMGAAFKYVFRREGKEPVRSLKSALYYLEDQRNHRLQVVLDWHGVEKIGFIANAEQNPVAKDFYKEFQDFLHSPTNAGIQKIEACILQLIAEAEKNEE